MMASILKLSSIKDGRGALTVIDKVLPFEIKRVFYIYGCSDLPRGGHRHRKTRQALICLAGSCVVDWTNGRERGSEILDEPDKALILPPEDWHVMRNFSRDAILLVLASEHYDAGDYIHEGYGE
jgi:hypothetical protein